MITGVARRTPRAAARAEPRSTRATRPWVGPGARDHRVERHPSRAWNASPRPSRRRTRGGTRRSSAAARSSRVERVRSGRLEGIPHLLTSRSSSRSSQLHRRRADPAAPHSESDAPRACCPFTSSLRSHRSMTPPPATRPSARARAERRRGPGGRRQAEGEAASSSGGRITLACARRSKPRTRAHPGPPCSVATLVEDMHQRHARRARHPVPNAASDGVVDALERTLEDAPSNGRPTHASAVDGNVACTRPALRPGCSPDAIASRRSRCERVEERVQGATRLVAASRATTHAGFQSTRRSLERSGVDRNNGPAGLGR